MSENPLFVSMPLDGRKEIRFVDWGNSPFYRERAIAASTHPDSARDRLAVLPYILRGATSFLVMQYTGLTVKAESRSRQWIVKHNKVCNKPETVSIRKKFADFERRRAQTEDPEMLQKMVIMGTKLVERGVISGDTAVWDALQQTALRVQPEELVTGFPELLILESISQARIRNLSAIEAHIMALLAVGRLTDHFEGAFSLINR